MTTETDARVNISIDAPLMPFGQFQIRIRETGHEANASGTTPRRRETAPYSFPHSTGDRHKLVFRQGASAL